MAIKLRLLVFILFSTPMLLFVKPDYKSVPRTLIRSPRIARDVPVRYAVRLNSNEGNTLAEGIHFQNWFW